MGKLEDMALLVAVAEAGTLAAGRRLSLSPATMTARLKAMEGAATRPACSIVPRARHPDQGGEDFIMPRGAVLEGPSRRIVADAKEGC